MTRQAGKGGLARVPGFPHVAGAALLLLAAPTPGRPQTAGAGPGFDCGRAREPLSQMICMDRGLSQDDLQLVQAYQALRASLPDGTEREQLRQEALTMPSRVISICGPPASGVANWTMLQAGKGCVSGVYAGQRQAWLSRLSGTALEEATRPTAAMAALQTRLQGLGFLPPDAVPDAVYGPATRGAITAWQTGTGRPATGMLGDADAAALTGGNALNTSAGSPKLPPAAAAGLGMTPQPSGTTPPVAASAMPPPPQLPQQTQAPPTAFPVRAATPGMPPAEAALIAAVQAARQQYRDAPNDMARGAARPTRARAICAALGSLQARGWSGTVKELSSNGDGKGVLTISIGENTSVGTWPNALSDILDDTLIDPASPVFAQAAALRRGQRVRFSGRFAASDTDCLGEMSVTLSGSIREPEFVFVFEAITPAE